MKYKIYIFILIIAIYFFPTKTFGFFAIPDQRIHSMPFSAQSNKADFQGIPIVPEISQINSKNTSNDDVLQPAAFSIGENNLTDMSWLVFLSATMIAIIIFISLKFKKML